MSLILKLNENTGNVETLSCCLQGEHGNAKSKMSFIPAVAHKRVW